MSQSRRANGWWPVLLAVLAPLGALFLMPDLAGWWRLAVIGPFVLFATLRWALKPRFFKRIAVPVGALLIPLFTLLGADAVWAVALPRLGAWLSVAVGAAILGGAVWIYLSSWWVDEPSEHPWRWVIGIAGGLVLLPAAVFFGLAQVNGDPGQLEQQLRPVSAIDVVVLAENPDSGKPESPYRHGWHVRKWNGRVDGDGIHWGIAGPPPRLASDHADRVLLIAVGGDSDAIKARTGRAPQDEAAKIKRWLKLADEAMPTDTPTYALLDTDDADRVKAWHDALSDLSDPDARHGDALGRKDFGESDPTDLALRLAVLDPANDQNLALAAQHRPALFFDDGEHYSTPLNIDALLKSGLIRACNRGQAVPRLCPALHGSADLTGEAFNLAFDPAALDGLRAQTTIYVNVTRSGNDARNTIYLDYWWYLPDNPAGTAGGALCGAGFVIAGVTCMDHESDWEGVTVVLDADSPSSRPLAVSYAQHEGVTRYSWAALERLWKQSGDRAHFGKGIDTARRPLVFVARGTHASYPRSCSDTKCSDRLPGVKATRPFRDNRHDGGKPWAGNDEVKCDAVCIEPLPTHGPDRAPARWNAFGGRWGSSQCVFGIGVLCASSQPPQSPARQKRYGRPWNYTESFRLAGDKYVPGGGRLAEREPSADEINKGERLLALGDSYSSGEGGGNYEPSTDGHGNSCHRSPNAWPQRLAKRRGLVPLPSLACSGAVTRDVTDGRPGGESERRHSQIGRIRRNPGVITITIGGNDARFADVLKDCVMHDCVGKYHKPSGDVLEARIADLRQRLPVVYRAIRDAAPRARLVVAGYPRLFARDDGPRPVGNCAAGRQISAQEAAYLNARTVSLNAAIAGAARDAGADFADVTNAFDGQELRCSGPSYLNRLDLRRKLFSASFHPNADGYNQLATVIAGQISSRR